MRRPDLLALAGWTALVYRRGFASGITSDGWVMLEIGSRGLWQAVRATLSYHTIPVANLFIAVLWRLFGFAEHGYQILNLAQLALTGWLLCRLGRRLFADSRIGLVAGLLFVANGSFYDVTLWPVVGNLHSLAAMLYLGGLFAVLRTLRAPHPARWAALFAAASLLAFLTYEPALSVAPAGLLLAFSSRGDDAAALRRARRALLAALLVAAVAVLRIKIWGLSQGSVLAQLPGTFDELTTRLFLAVRAVIALFTLRGDDATLYTIFSFGMRPPIGSRLFLWLLAAWLLVLLAAAALLAVKARERAVAFLVLWLGAHLATVAAATPPVSRHFYLAALPASILASWVLWRAAHGLASLVRPPAARSRAGLHRHLPAALVLVLVAVLAGGAQADVTAAAALHDQLTRATQRVIRLAQQRLALTDPLPQRLVLVNMPILRTEGGIGAMAFGNGLQPMLQVVTGGKIRRPRLFFTYEGRPRERFVERAVPVSLPRLARLVRHPRTQVLMYDDRDGTVVELRPSEWHIPREYSAESAPYLAWQGGSWPWLRLHHGLALQLPLSTPGAGSWIALRYRQVPETSFTVKAGDGPLRRVRAPAGAGESWPSTTLPVAAGQGESTLTIQPESEVWLAGVWSFAPPASYTPQGSAFLSWNLQPFPAFTVSQPIALPLANPACAQPDLSCRLEIEYLAEQGRDFDLEIEGAGAPVRLGTSAAPQWQTTALAGPRSAARTVIVTPRGRAPVVVRRLAWIPASTPR